jgi:hypothetical protein
VVPAESDPVVAVKPAETGSKVATALTFDEGEKVTSPSRQSSKRRR